MDSKKTEVSNVNKTCSSSICLQCSFASTMRGLMPCDVCPPEYRDLLYMDSKELAIHQSFQHDKLRPVSCYLCSTRLSNIMEFKQHMYNFHRRCSIHVRCYRKRCFKIISMDYLDVHYKSFHPSLEQLDYQSSNIGETIALFGLIENNFVATRYYCFDCSKDFICSSLIECNLCANAPNPIIYAAFVKTLDFIMHLQQDHGLKFKGLLTCPFKDSGCTFLGEVSESSDHVEKSHGSCKMHICCSPNCTVLLNVSNYENAHFKPEECQHLEGSNEAFITYFRHLKSKPLKVGSIRAADLKNEQNSKSKKVLYFQKNPAEIGKLFYASVLKCPVPKVDYDTKFFAYSCISCSFVSQLPQDSKLVHHSCPFCHLVFFSLIEAKAHVSSFHRYAETSCRNKCTECELIADTSEKVIRHRSQVHSLCREHLLCVSNKACKCVFKTLRQLSRHLSVNECKGPSVKSETEKQPGPLSGLDNVYKCTSCTFSETLDPRNFVECSQCNDHTPVFLVSEVDLSVHNYLRDQLDVDEMLLLQCSKAGCPPKWLRLLEYFAHRDQTHNFCSLHFVCHFKDCRTVMPSLQSLLLHQVTCQKQDGGRRSEDLETKNANSELQKMLCSYSQSLKSICPQKYVCRFCNEVFESSMLFFCKLCAFDVSPVLFVDATEFLFHLTLFHKIKCEMVLECNLPLRDNVACKVSGKVQEILKHRIMNHNICAVHIKCPFKDCNFLFDNLDDVLSHRTGPGHLEPVKPKVKFTKLEESSKNWLNNLSSIQTNISPGKPNPPIVTNHGHSARQPEVGASFEFKHQLERPEAKIVETATTSRSPSRVPILPLPVATDNEVTSTSARSSIRSPITRRTLNSPVRPTSWNCNLGSDQDLTSKHFTQKRSGSVALVDETPKQKTLSGPEIVSRGTVERSPARIEHAFKNLSQKNNASGELIAQNQKSPVRTLASTEVSQSQIQNLASVELLSPSPRPNNLTPESTFRTSNLVSASKELVSASPKMIAPPKCLLRSPQQGVTDPTELVSKASKALESQAWIPGQPANSVKTSSEITRQTGIERSEKLLDDRVESLELWMQKRDIPVSAKSGDQPRSSSENTQVLPPPLSLRGVPEPEFTQLPKKVTGLTQKEDSVPLKSRDVAEKDRNDSSGVGYGRGTNTVGFVPRHSGANRPMPFSQAHQFSDGFVRPPNNGNASVGYSGPSGNNDLRIGDKTKSDVGPSKGNQLNVRPPERNEVSVGYVGPSTSSNVSGANIRFPNVNQFDDGSIKPPGSAQSSVVGFARPPGSNQFLSGFANAPPFSTKGGFLPPSIRDGHSLPAIPNTPDQIADTIFAIEANHSLSMLSVNYGKNSEKKSPLANETFNFIESIRDFVSYETEVEASENLLSQKGAFDLGPFVTDHENSVYFGRFILLPVVTKSLIQSAPRFKFYACSMCGFKRDFINADFMNHYICSKCDIAFLCELEATYHYCYTHNKELPKLRHNLMCGFCRHSASTLDDWINHRRRHHKFCAEHIVCMSSGCLARNVFPSKESLMDHIFRLGCLKKGRIQRIDRGNSPYFAELLNTNDFLCQLTCIACTFTQYKKFEGLKAVTYSKCCANESFATSEDKNQHTAALHHNSSGMLVQKSSQTCLNCQVQLPVIASMLHNVYNHVQCSEHYVCPNDSCMLLFPSPSLVAIHHKNCIMTFFTFKQKEILARTAVGTPPLPDVAGQWKKKPVTSGIEDRSTTYNFRHFPDRSQFSNRQVPPFRNRGRSPPKSQENTRSPPRNRDRPRSPPRNRERSPSKSTWSDPKQEDGDFELGGFLSQIRSEASSSSRDRSRDDSRKNQRDTGSSENESRKSERKRQRRSRSRDRKQSEESTASSIDDFLKQARYADK